jgi:hypothetical protein
MKYFQYIFYKYIMIISINLPEYYGLIDIMMADIDHDGNMSLNGAACSILEDPESAAGIFEAASADFNFAAVFPRWYVGECSVYPVTVFAEGELAMLFRWLPIAREDKLAIIDHLPVGDDDQVLLRLAV